MYEFLSPVRPRFQEKGGFFASLDVPLPFFPAPPPVGNETSASSAAYTGIGGCLRHLPGRNIVFLVASVGTPGFDSLHRGGAWFAKVLS